MVFEPEFRNRVIDLSGVEWFESMLHCAAGTRVCHAVHGEPQETARRVRCAVGRSAKQVAGRRLSVIFAIELFTKRACYGRSSAEDRACSRVATTDRSTAFHSRADGDIVFSGPQSGSLDWT